MSTKTINIFIDKYTQRITPSIIIATNLLSLVLFFLSTCLLVTIKNYIIIAVLLGLLIAQLVAFSLLNRKKDITIYRALFVSFVMLTQLLVSVNICLYCIQNILGIFNHILLFVILIIEVACLGMGILYTTYSIKREATQKTRHPVATIGIAAISSISTYIFTRFVINKTPDNIQGALYTLSLSAIACLMMFYLGKIHFSMMYFIKKYRIPDRKTSTNSKT